MEKIIILLALVIIKTKKIVFFCMLQVARLLITGPVLMSLPKIPQTVNTEVAVPLSAAIVSCRPKQKSVRNFIRVLGFLFLLIKDPDIRLIAVIERLMLFWWNGLNLFHL